MNESNLKIFQIQKTTIDKWLHEFKFIWKRSIIKIFILYFRFISNEI